MKKKNKGFTLIELLAVIVILGIILTIVVSNVVKYIGKAREGAFKDTYAKVLKDVSNKIALNDLGGDTEEVECKNPTECAAAYDVPEENIALSVYSMGDDEYGVRMTGKGNYASISLSSTNCTNNAKCEGQSMSSTVNSDGEVSPSEISIKNGSDFNKVIIGSVPEVKEIEEVKYTKLISYVKYKNNNEDTVEKIYDYEGKELTNFLFTGTYKNDAGNKTFKVDGKKSEMFRYLDLLGKLLSKGNDEFKNILDANGYDTKNNEEDNNAKSEYIQSNPDNFISIQKDDIYYIKFSQSNSYYYLSVPTMVYSEKNSDILLFNDNDWRCVYNRKSLKGMGNFQCNHK